MSMDDKLYFARIAIAASENEKQERARREAQTTKYELFKWSNAEEAYSLFLPMIEAFGYDVISFKIDKSSLISETPSAIVADKKGRTFEIFYDPRGLGDSLFHANIQWRDERWHTYTVSMNANRLAELFGKWMAQD